MKKNTYLVLGLVYLSFIALGLPDGAFGVAWPSIRYEMQLPLAQAGIIMIIHSIFYSLSSSQLGRIANKLKLEHIDLLGLILMGLGLFGFSTSPNFIVMATAVAVTGCGMGMVDSSLNSYIAKNFSARHMNWLHCFWGLGAAVSPIIMAQMILFADWRTGYAVLAAVQIGVAIIVLMSFVKRVWQQEEKAQVESPEPKKGGSLYKKRHQFLMVFVCFLYIGAEASVSFWITSVMLESRGMSHDQAALFPAVFFIMIMTGRMVAGYLADKFRDADIIRFGFALAFVGLLILMFSSNIAGIVLIGFGYAPIFPCLVNDTSNRFSPKVLTKMVGYEVASVGAGVAIISAGMGQVLSMISLEALFPVLMVIIVIALGIYEVLLKISANPHL